MPGFFEVWHEGFTEEQACDHMKATLPTLDYWKRYEELSDFQDSWQMSLMLLR